VADTDWGGILGTVVMGGFAVKMTQSVFGDSSVASGKKKKSKAKVGYPSTQYRPW